MWFREKELRSRAPPPPSAPCGRGRERMRCRALSEHGGGRGRWMRSDRHRLNMGQHSPGTLRLSTFPRGVLRAQLKEAVDSTPVKLYGGEKKKKAGEKETIKRLVPALPSEQGKLTRIIVEKGLCSDSQITPSHRRAPTQPPKAGQGWLGWQRKMGSCSSSITHKEINCGTKEVLHLGHAQELWGETNIPHRDCRS